MEAYIQQLQERQSKRTVQVGVCLACCCLDLIPNTPYGPQTLPEMPSENKSRSKFKFI